MLAELAEVLSYERFRPRLAQLGVTPADLLGFALGLVTVYEATSAGATPLVAADPDDDMFLQAAVAARAICIVSGDAHMLALGQYANIPIVTLRDFLARELAAP